MASEIVLDIQAPVATIRIARGAKRNAITSDMYADLASSLETLAERDDVRVVVLTGTDGSFTAGNDLRDMAENPDTGPDSPPSRFLRALVAGPQVLVVAVDGPAIGIGSTVLLHADLVYATRSSVFRMPFVSLGLVPEAASTYLLPTLVGHPVAAELLLLGRVFSADEALSWRLVNEVLPDEATLRDRVDEVVAALAAQPAAALLSTRRLLRAHREAPVGRRLDEDGALMRELAATLQNGAGR
ncbi:MAG TPA: enoyl-CoA hydratase-related protein [Jatrophihabitantaceae bacterium]|nr:enoyl-CoA hydratase-related protein [Jatrophihabitantaceae bacterium]